MLIRADEYSKVQIEAVSFLELHSCGVSGIQGRSATFEEVFSTLVRRVGPEMRAFIRVSSFFEQWTAEVLRQPGLMFTLILVPFLLLLAFGDGVKIGGPRPRTIMVQSPDAQQPIEPLLENLPEEVEIVGITEVSRWPAFSAKGRCRRRRRVGNRLTGHR